VTPAEDRRQTPGTSAEELRRAIVRAAAPLLGDRDALTTAQLAAAAGTEEAVLLRLFADKDAIIRECIDVLRASIEAVLDPSRLLRELESIPVEQPLAPRLVRVIDALDAHHARIRTGLVAWRDSLAPAPDPAAPGTTPVGGAAPTPGASSAGERGGQPFGRDYLRAVARLDVIDRAVTRLVEPDQERLRLPAATVAQAFLGMSSDAARGSLPEGSRPSAEQFVDLFLHGALTPTDRA
jgi:AcrR family transcriptional regulator